MGSSNRSDGPTSAAPGNLIVAFAKKPRESGVPRHEATLAACRLRLRPIIMTSFAFILGVVPLALSVGAGAKMRRTLGEPVRPERDVPEQELGYV